MWKHESPHAGCNRSSYHVMYGYGYGYVCGYVYVYVYGYGYV